MRRVPSLFLLVSAFSIAAGVSCNQPGTSVGTSGYGGGTGGYTTGGWGGAGTTTSIVAGPTSVSVVSSNVSTSGSVIPVSSSYSSTTGSPCSQFYAVRCFPWQNPWETTVAVGSTSTTGTGFGSAVASTTGTGFGSSVASVSSSIATGSGVTTGVTTGTGGNPSCPTPDVAPAAWHLQGLTVMTTCGLEPLYPFGPTFESNANQCCYVLETIPPV